MSKKPKNSASKNTFNPPESGNPPSQGSKQERSQTRGQFEQDPKRRIGNFGSMGEHEAQR